MYSLSTSTSTTIYVGNIQSIKDEQLREYFQRFGNIEALYHNCTRAADEWLIDYRFIRFSSDTDMNIFFKNKIDHIICRIVLDIHPYEAAFRDETRLMLDRKICIAHTDSKLNRNAIKKSFTRYGRILNCICTSSGNGVEHAYIEFESVNSIQSVFTPGQRYFAGRTSLAVKKPLKPSEAGVKIESISIDEKSSRSTSISKYSYCRPRLNSNVETAQYSSFLVNHHNRIIENEFRTSTLIPNQLLDLSSESQHRISSPFNIQQSDNNIESSLTSSQQELKDYEHEYDLIIRKDFDEITYQIDKFLQNQKKSYKKLRQFILNELHSQSSSSSSDEGEIESSSSESSIIPENIAYNHKKRLRSHH
ncbi:unnamed protein product [Rotaria sordida]|uniref:RRM domain-containing protein n=2 Tax=Rotaria sordida TaxID=392033 RepID=A0A813T511_9BILA|nr:unnamed protein product [Rotaria sordida]CAF0829940.1 unnamed protein product [Rotaria sordida]CAF0856554.1 unnamed protein product [Rotaria sordida]CAF3962861.1 unnamed protein product [Rotaria sordida]